MALEGEEVAHRARAQRCEQAGPLDGVAGAARRAGGDEGDHVAVEAEVHHGLPLERAHARAGAGVIGHEPHAAAALRTAARIFT